MNIKTPYVCMRCTRPMLVSAFGPIPLVCSPCSLLIEQYYTGLQWAACSDTHSSDVDPGRVGPWAER